MYLSNQIQKLAAAWSLSLMLATTPALAQNEPPPPPVDDAPPAMPDSPEPPPPPPPVRSGEALEPDITILRSEPELVEQYSINGRVYMVKVTPKNGTPYYFIDSDGDGTLDTHRGDPRQPIEIPKWLLFSW